jgi:hypothetical protein
MVGVGGAGDVSGPPASGQLLGRWWLPPALVGAWARAAGTGCAKAVAGTGTGGPRRARALAVAAATATARQRSGSTAEKIDLEMKRCAEHGPR